MKIKNKRSYSRTSSGTKDTSDSLRTAHFRQHHRVGQTVFGHLVRWENPGMAWVNIDNTPLLASLSSRPAPGSRLTFLIRKLTPEIVLQELSKDASNAPAILDIISEFNTLRTQFEAASAPLWEQFQPSNAHTTTRKAFFDALSTNAVAYSAFLDVTACVAKINSYNIAQSTFCYWPWLIPGAHAQATTLHKKTGSPSFYEIIHEFESMEHGLAQVQLLYKQPKASYRLQLQRNASSVKNKAMIHALVPPSIDIHCIGITPLPRSSYGGILTGALTR